MPIEELAKKSKANLEKVITRVVQSEQIKSAETIEGKIKNIDNLWNSEKQKINRSLIAKVNSSAEVNSTAR